MNQSSVIPMVLLLLFGVAVGLCGLAVMFVLFYGQRRRRLQSEGSKRNSPSFGTYRQAFLSRPSSWLAIRSRSLQAVQSALGLHNAKPCSFLEGMSDSEKLFIAPPVNGWILVLGAGVPEPGEDIDLCFRFVLDLSRKLGEVQYFSASRILQAHAWVRAERGRVVRAY